MKVTLERNELEGKEGGGAFGKIKVFGILKRGGNVYAQIIENCTKEEIWSIIKGKVLRGEKIYSDGFKTYDGLIYNYDHYRIHHSKNEFARGKNHVNGIEYFWSFTKKKTLKIQRYT